MDVLFGHVNPSGKLPYTVGKSLEDYGSGAPIMYYPNAPIPQQDFTDGLYIDYRHFDKVRAIESSETLAIRLILTATTVRCRTSI